jgi:prepilin peptidase CpaA
MMGIIPVLIPSAILAAGAADDLRSRKVHNELVLVLLVVAIAFSLFEGGAQGLLTGLLGMGAAILMTLPLVLFGIIGAGDLKLFMVFGFATTWEIVVYVGVAALVWGAILGVLRAIVAGEFKSLVSNTFGIVGRKPVKELHRIPYTAALFMGWISYLAANWRGA